MLFVAPPMQTIRASAHYRRAIHATAELLEKLRIKAMFVGGVARAAWLEEEIDRGAVDLVALMNAPQKNQVATMASHRGFRVVQTEIDQSEELDLVPLNFVDPAGDIRVHVLLASNALYGRMVAASQSAEIDDRPVRVARAEDLALMLLVGGDDESVGRLRRLPEFDAAAFDERLVSIGLRGKAGGA